MDGRGLARDTVEAGLDLGILGELRVRVDGQPVEIGSVKQQICLALLLCRANRPTSVELLIEAIWGDDPPLKARKSVQVYVAGLRKLFGPGGDCSRIEHRVGGYVLAAGPAELDAVRFEQLVNAARAARHDGAAAVAGMLQDAVRLWRGPMVETLTGVPTLDREVERLTQLYLSALESWAQAEISLGNADAVLDRLETARQRHPLRERLAVLAMTALAQCGRQDEALAVYAELRQVVSHELGLSPSAAAQTLYGQLLTGGGPAVSAPSPAMLPADPTRFTGRHTALATAAELLTRRESGLVLLTGPLGSGKTAMAVRLAHRLGQGFPDGRVFVRMREADGTPRPLRAQLAALRRLTGWPDPTADDAEQAADHWRAWAARRRILLVLDDAAGHAEVLALLPEGGPTAAVVTSRSRLPGLDDCDRLAVDPLSPPEALTLLGLLVGEDRVGTDRASATRIVTELGRLPLPIHRAGLRLSYLPHVSLAEFAQRLAGGCVLAELDTADAELRGRVNAAIRDLAETDRTALLRLGTLAPAFTLDEAAAALGTPSAQARRTVESLIAWNSVTAPDPVAGAAQYRLAVLIHAYLRELADANPLCLTGSSAARTRSSRRPWCSHPPRREHHGPFRRG